MRRFSDAERAVIWDMREAGVPVKGIARHLGRENSPQCAGSSRRRAGSSRRREDSALARLGALSFGSRWRNERRSLGGWLLDGRCEGSLRVCAGRLRRCLERSPPCGGRGRYRALRADRQARCRALRPKTAKLAQCRRLRVVVEHKLEALWSPEQISAGWLVSIRASRRCRCLTRPSTSRCSSRAVGRCAVSCIPVCVAAGQCVEPRPSPRAGSVRASSATW
jgi:hypothetical protein